MKKVKELGQLPEGTILCTIDVVGLYPNIPHDEGLAFLKDFLDSRVDKQVTTDTLIELTELVLKNNIFEFSDKTYKQIRGTAIGTKFAPPYAVLFFRIKRFFMICVRFFKGSFADSFIQFRFVCVVVTTYYGVV